MPDTPTAPPRKGRKDRPVISPPFNYVHVTHVGLDFNATEVRKAIRPMSENLDEERANNASCSVYEAVDRSSQETPILTARNDESQLGTPEMDAPVYEPVPQKPVSSRNVKQESSIHYENVPTSHLYENLRAPADGPRPSRKKNPPPPPPKQGKPRLLSDEELEETTPVAFRKTSSQSEKTEQPLQSPITTKSRVEQANISMVLDRPDMLGEMRIGLDDPIPLQTGPSSKYRTPSMLTPSPNHQREVAVDVHTGHTPEPIPDDSYEMTEKKASSSKRKAPAPPLPLQKVVAEMETRLQHKNHELEENSAINSSKDDQNNKEKTAEPTKTTIAVKKELEEKEIKNTDVVKKYDFHTTKVDDKDCETLTKTSELQQSQFDKTPTELSREMRNNKPEKKVEVKLEKKETVAKLESEVDAVTTQLCADLDKLENEGMEKHKETTGAKIEDKPTPAVPVPKPRKRVMNVVKSQAQDENTKPSELVSENRSHVEQRIKKKLTAVVEESDTTAAAIPEIDTKTNEKENVQSSNWETSSVSDDEDDLVVRF